MLITAIVFFLILGVLIFVHELGHFVTAKRAGIKVEEFGFGFPPRIWGIKRGETIYSINWIPLGGFVKIHGEDGQDKKDPRSFGSKSVWIRAWILVSGVLMNFLLAAVLLSIGFGLGGIQERILDNQELVSNPEVVIGEVALDSPAEEAGLVMGDVIVKLQYNENQITTTKVKEVIGFIDKYKGNELLVTIKRGDKVIEKNILARANPPANEGFLGISLIRADTIAYPWYLAIYKGSVYTVELTGTIIVIFASLIWNLITEGFLLYEIGGPVKIFIVTGQAVELGVMSVLQLAALININIAIINILPLPALDGGRLIFLIIEKIKGSPVSQKIEGWTHAVGFALLILLMVAITWRDVVKHFF